MFTYKEFKKLLNMHKYRNLDSETEYNLYNFFVNRGLDFFQASAYLNGAKKRAIISSENEKLIRLNLLDLISQYSSQADIELFKRIHEIDGKFKEVYRNAKIKHPNTDKVIKAVNKAIKSRSDAFTHELREFTEAELEKMWNVACIYNTINNKLNKNGENFETDAIIGQGFAKSIEKNQKLKLDSQLVADVEGLLESLTSKTDNLPDDEIFTAIEVQRLLKRTTSLLYSTDKIKATQVREVLKSYLMQLNTLAESRPETKEFLNKTTAKAVVLKAGTILSRTPELISEGLDLMMEKNVQQIMETRQENSKSVRDKQKRELRELMPNLKIQGFDLDTHVYMIQKKTSLIASLNLLTVAKSANQLIDGLSSGLIEGANELSTKEKIEKLGDMGINSEDLLHADNVFDLTLSDPLALEEKQLSFSGNVKTLSQILSTKDIQKIVRHNLGLLCQDPEWVKNEINEILNKNRNDRSGLKEELEKFVNTQYKLNEPQAKSASSLRPQSQSTEIEENILDVNAEHDYIELDLFKLDSQEENLKGEEVTQDNYLDMLYFELSELNTYLESKIKNEKPVLQAGSLGFMVNKINSGKYEDFDKGAIINKLVKVKKMFEYLQADPHKPSTINRTVQSLIDKIESRQTILGLEIQETESLADELFLADVNRDKNETEKYKEYLRELDFVKERKQKVKSKGLIKKYQKDEVFLENRIGELSEHNENIKQNREFFMGLYVDRSTQMDEDGCLEGIQKVLQQGIANTPQKEGNAEICIDTGAKARELECLQKVLEKNKMKFNAIYRTQKSKNSAHAKKWMQKIEELEKRVYELTQEQD